MPAEVPHSLNRLSWKSFRRNKKVWNLLFQILEDRMRKGELTFIDAMHIYSEDLSIYKKLSEKYRYRLYIIDFTDIKYEELLNRNKQRETKS